MPEKQHEPQRKTVLMQRPRVKHVCYSRHIFTQDKTYCVNLNTFSEATVKRATNTCDLLRWRAMLQVLLPTLQQIKSLQFSWILTSTLRGRRKKGRERGRENSTKVSDWIKLCVTWSMEFTPLNAKQVCLGPVKRGMWMGKTRNIYKFWYKK